MRRVPIATAIAVAGLALATACGSSSKSATSTPATSTAAGSSAAATSTGNAVMIKNFMFTPMSLTVKAGTKVTWTNTDTATHTVTAKDKSFDSGDLATGKSFSFTFTKPGTYAYICDIHQYMTATVVVS